MKILDVGCGNQKTKRDGATVIGIDNNPESDADIMYDLDVFPYPFKDNEFDEILCFDVVEHLHNSPAVIREIHRIGKKGAMVHIRTPHFSSLCAYIDPTHLRPFSVLSFDCFCENPRVGSHIHKPFFRLKKSRISFPKFTRIFLFPFVFLANKFPLRYEEHFAFLLQAENIHLELEIIK
jgi:SAM-dependent methyltransferase